MKTSVLINRYITHWPSVDDCNTYYVPMEWSKLTELQSTILDAIADDYEDVEQLYLHVNPNLPEIRIPLRDVVDELTRMLREGYIAIKHSNNELVAPLQPVEFTALHHYWFEPTDKGTEAWKAFRLL